MSDEPSAQKMAVGNLRGGGPKYFFMEMILRPHTQSLLWPSVR